MSVLTKMISQRADWSSRQRTVIARQSEFRAIAEYALMIVIGLVVYTRYDTILELTKTLLNR